MTLVAVNHGAGVAQGVVAQARALTPQAPVIVMIHGYRFSPASPRHDPHRHILAMRPDPQARRVLSWPRALGFGGAGDAGLGVAYGWEARGRLATAYARAGDAGRGLADLVARLADATGRPVAMIAHSMGARVALAALGHLPPGAAGRLILLAGAEFRCVAGAAMASAAGARAEVINITSRENDPFDLGLEVALGGLRRRALGFGLAPAQARANWLDIQIDQPETLAALSGLGFRVDPTALRMCHWSPYLRAGVFDFYRTALRTPWALPLGLLRMHLPARAAPRWSRLLGGGQGPLLPSSSGRA